MQRIKRKYTGDFRASELTNRESKTPFIIITGTNGKTTTTALTEHILSKSLNVKACGNIGQPQVILPMRI